MFHALRKMFGGGHAPRPVAMAPGQRIYAVGDIHGRYDLFARLAAAIEADDSASVPARSTVILLGDLVDRGSDSAGVVRLAREWQAMRDVRVLTGNHEEMFLRSFDDLETFRHFLRHGGRDTILSYGVDRAAFMSATLEEAQELMRAAVPEQDVAFMQSFEDMICVGDYVFVHAGIDPRLPLEHQKPKDLRWIREPFLSCPDSYGAVIVHGHTISENPEDCGNRIGIDTGAFMTGRLTALVLEGVSRRYITASVEPEGEIAITGLAA